MAAVTICSNFGAPQNKIWHCFHCFPIYFPWSDGTGCHDLVFWMLSFKPTFSLSSFTFIKRLFSSSSLSAIRVVSSAYLRLLMFLLAILIPACASSSPAFLMMYSTHKLNKQGDNIQPWRTPFPTWNQSVVPCPVLTVASWPAYRFLKRQVRWSGIPISFRIFHSLLWSTQSKRIVRFSKYWLTTWWGWERKQRILGLILAAGPPGIHLLWRTGVILSNSLCFPRWASLCWHPQGYRCIFSEPLFSHYHSVAQMEIQGQFAKCNCYVCGTSDPWGGLFFLNLFFFFALFCHLIETLTIFHSSPTSN